MGQSKRMIEESMDRIATNQEAKQLWSGFDALEESIQMFVGAHETAILESHTVSNEFGDLSCDGWELDTWTATVLKYGCEYGKFEYLDVYVEANGDRLEDSIATPDRVKITLRLSHHFHATAPDEDWTFEVIDARADTTGFDDGCADVEDPPEMTTEELKKRLKELCEEAGAKAKQAALLLSLL